MHVEAVGAAVDLRNPKLDQVEQLLIKTGLADKFEAQHGLINSGRKFE